MPCDNASYRFIHAEGELRSQAIALHRQRYLEVGFMPEDFQDPYEEGSLYFVAWHERNQRVVGVCRLVLQELWTLPTYRHFELFEHERRALDALQPGTYTELGALAKLPHTPNVAPGLIAAALAHAAAQRMPHVLCCIDQQLFQSMRTRLGIPFRVIGKGKLFYGSIKIPCVVNSAETLERLKAHSVRSLHPLELPEQEPGRPPVQAA